MTTHKASEKNEAREIEKELAQIPVSEIGPQKSLRAFVSRHGAMLRARKDEGVAWESLAQYVRTKLGQPGLKTSSLKSYMASLAPCRPKPVKKKDTAAPAAARPAIVVETMPRPAIGMTQQTERVGSSLPTMPKRRD